MSYNSPNDDSVGKPEGLSLYSVIVVLFVLNSYQPWFLWNGTVNVGINVLTFFMSLVYVFRRQKIRLPSSSILISAFVLVLFFLFISAGFNISGLLYTMLNVTSLLIMLVVCTDEEKIRLWLFFQKTLCSILIISLFAWILHLCGVYIPYSTTSYKDYNFLNYRFFLEINEAARFSIPRFSSVFLEPGHLATLLGLVLYVNKYDMKKLYNVVALLSLLTTFSLAGYILLAAGWLFRLFISSKVEIGKVALLLSIVAGVVVYSSSYNDGHNILNESIIMRLVVDEGELADGTQRDSEYMEQTMHSMLSSSKRFTGLGVQRVQQIISIDKGNAGYKTFIVTHGLIGLFLVVMLYSVYPISQCKRTGLFFSLLYLMSFAQRSYPHWMIFVFIMICGTAYMSQKSKSA